MRQLSIVALFSLLCVCLIPGCSKSESRKSPPTVPFTGKVTVDGNPANLAMVKLVPEDATKGFGGFAITTKDGSFEIMAQGTSNKGVPVGSYKVLINTFFLGEGYDPNSPDNLPGMKPPTPEQGTPTEIPKIYGDEQQTPLKIVVGETGDTKTFELKSK